MLLDSDGTRVRHMVDCAVQVLSFIEGRTRGDLDTDYPLQHLVIRNLEIIGEAASKISRGFRAEHPAVPWRDIVDMRNRLVHVYFDIDLDIIWATARELLPELLVQLRAIMRELDSGEGASREEQCP
ncbi:MAG: DUF86 domain-containing protein [Candidatus Hydrogenedentes bacterium]|nr:DUF86 domain-containing protein [Candidatus Hydrogenedentota bacterium]